MRRLLVCLLLCGCGGGDGYRNEAVVDGTITPAPIPALPISAKTAPIVASLGQFLLDGSSAADDYLGANSDLTTLQALTPTATLEELLAAWSPLSGAGSRTLTGPQGVTAQVDVSGATVTVTFTNYSFDAAVLNGTVAMRGSGATVSGAFSQLQSTGPGRGFQLDGPASLTLTRSSEGVTVAFSTDARVLGLGTGGTATFGGSTANVQLDLSGNGSARREGGLVFSNFLGLTGSLVVTNPTPFAFSAGMTTAGQIFYAGDGVLRQTVVGPNTLETAVQESGRSDFVVIPAQ